MSGDRHLVEASKVKVLRAIKEASGIKKGQIVKRAHVPRYILDRTLRKLIAEGLVEVRRVPRGYPSFDQDTIFEERYYLDHPILFPEDMVGVQKVQA